MSIRLTQVILQPPYLVELSTEYAFDGGEIGRWKQVYLYAFGRKLWKFAPVKSSTGAAVLEEQLFGGPLFPPSRTLDKSETRATLSKCPGDK